MAGTEFPKVCPERHIEGDGKFCLGLDRPEIHTIEAAQEWWEALRQFLLCQRVADDTEVWPPSSSLDHGDAGEWHAKSLELARELGVEEQYKRARTGEKNWINDLGQRLVDRHGEPINGRSPCPMGCTWTKRGRRIPKLRSECSRRSQVIELVKAERLRMEKLDEFWVLMGDSGSECCRTMRDCPLRDRVEAA